MDFVSYYVSLQLGGVDLNLLAADLSFSLSASHRILPMPLPVGRMQEGAVRGDTLSVIPRDTRVRGAQPGNLVSNMLSACLVVIRYLLLRGEAHEKCYRPF